ncbi:MAG: protein kinase [Planctomycetota bacterium]
MPQKDLDEILAEIFLAQEEGSSDLDPAVWFSRYPEHVEELREFFRNQDWMATPVPDDIEKGPFGIDGGDNEDPLIGKTIGEYRLIDRIACGGMGTVYRTEHPRLLHPLAIKIVRGGAIADEEARRRFAAEAKAASALKHPGLVPIVDYGNDVQADYLVMPLVDGCTLQDYLGRRGPIAIHSAIEWAIQMADAIDHAHGKGVLHRDLKPENVLLEDDQRPMVTDFGLARVDWEDSPRLTRTGQILGTPHYMSPEQAIRGGNVEPRSDVYGLGGLLYAMLSGKPPHDGESVVEVLRSVVQDHPLPLTAWRRDVPTVVERIVSRCLASDPNQRYASAADLAEDLRKYQRGERTWAEQQNLLATVLGELRRDQYGQAFQYWPRAVAAFGIIIFVAHLMIAIAGYLGFDSPVFFFGPRLLMLGALAIGIGYWRSWRWLPRTVAERPVYSIWLGYLAAQGTVNLLIFGGGLEADWLFPLTTVLSGLGFIAMSGHVWGVSAVFGIAMLASSLVMPLMPSWAESLLFGLLWLASLLAISSHYRRVRKR